MPSQHTLEAFIARVESNAHVEAIDEFYAADASMQENGHPPRMGKALLMAQEAKALAKSASVESECVRPVFINGDHVVIRWKFRFERLDGSVVAIEELAHQRWEGERIAQEQFFYDPVQFVPQPADKAT